MYVPTCSYSAEQRIRNSRFIAQAEPFADPRAVKPRIEVIRAAHPGCAHVVYAFSVGDAATRSFGMSDDGEPHGTAGRPVLDVLNASDITNCLVTVVRYFGGTKLGTGGLVRAYGSVAKEALGGLAVEPLVERRSFTVVVGYERYEPVRTLLLAWRARLGKVDFAERVRIRGEIPAEAASACADALREATSGAVSIEVDEE